MSKRYMPVKVNPEWQIDPLDAGTYHRVIRGTFGEPVTLQHIDGTYSYTWEFSDSFAPVPPHSPTVRSIATIEAEIRRATVPALRPEDV